MDNSNSTSLLRLFKGKHFTPYFFTTFFGTFNDNFFKQALVYILTFQLLVLAKDVNMDVFNNLASGVFIIPYVFFSALAGQIADKYEKSSLIRIVKIVEICIMLIAMLGFYLSSLPLLMLALILLGTQSSFFSPIKYSILPQHLPQKDLSSGNGLIEMGNFSAIIIGTILAGLVLKLPFSIDRIVVVVTLCIALLGFTTSRFIPSASPAMPDLKLDFNLFRQTGRILALTKKDKHTFYSVLGISWFWFLGAIMLSQMPRIVKSYMYAGADVLNAFMAAFSLGIGIGAVITAKFSHKKAELGFVVVSNLGLMATMTCLIALLFGITPAPDDIKNANLLHLDGFFDSTHRIALLVCYFCVGFFGGMYEIPLITSLQERSPKETLARLFAANNVYNAIFMVLSAVLAIFILSVLKLSMPILLIIVLILHVLMFLLLIRKMPILLQRFTIRFLKHNN